MDDRESYTMLFDISRCFFQHTFGFNSVVAINGQDATVLIGDTWGKRIMGSIA